MGRNLSPVLRRELENLDKDAECRKSAMKALNSYVKELDSKAIPHFLVQISEKKETGISSREHIIPLYEVLAHVHGPKIVPHIDSIMATIIKNLTSSAGSFALHQACSKVVPAIARYGMEPTTPEEKKRHIIHSLCKPLSDSLLGSLDSLSSGAALCLKALVDSDNWRFASNEMVNEVCQRVAGALENPTLTKSHMALVMALAQKSSLLVEAYARLLIHSGLRILDAGVAEGNSQKKLSAIQMVNLLMKCLDPKSIFSELGLVIEEMEKCQSGQMAYVGGAAFEALQTARRLATDKGSKFESNMGSITGANVGRRGNSRMRNLWGSEDQSPLTASPELQTVNSFVGYNSLSESPMSGSQTSPDSDYDQRSVNQKLWRIYQNGGVDVSVRDRLFSEVHDEFSDDRGDEFIGLLQRSPQIGVVRGTTPGPQRSCSHINADNVKIFTTPRKLICSVQEPNDVDFFENQTRRFTSPSSKLERISTSRYDQNGLSQDANDETETYGNLSIDGEQFHDSSESVYSTEDVRADSDLPESPNVRPGSKTESQGINVRKHHQKRTVNIFCGLFVLLFAVFVCFLLIDDPDEGLYLVPT
ncbi:unnamed protein product [Ilex paraguariensis]|uniref:TORTIFOLIA1/SINE1-2 N-terminal domain-containing protein n=1 Tax=Ilex paraguariensis TaxID=185542 RepID=A0ABC8SF02_9AQUA